MLPVCYNEILHCDISQVFVIRSTLVDNLAKIHVARFYVDEGSSFGSSSIVDHC